VSVIAFAFHINDGILCQRNNDVCNTTEDILTTVLIYRSKLNVSVNSLDSED
jgi:hypothetical protein